MTTRPVFDLILLASRTIVNVCRPDNIYWNNRAQGWALPTNPEECRRRNLPTPHLDGEGVSCGLRVPEQNGAARLFPHHRRY